MAKKANVRMMVSKDEPIEKVLRKFKRLCEKIGIKKMCKARRYYEKPNAERRKEMRKAQRNRRKLGSESFDPKKNKFKNNREWMFTHPKLDEE